MLKTAFLLTACLSLLVSRFQIAHSTRGEISRGGEKAQKIGAQPPGESAHPRLGGLPCAVSSQINVLSFEPDIAAPPAMAARQQPPQPPPRPGNANELYGTIGLPHAGRWMARGKGYNKDGAPAMHSDDPMADPNRNVIVSAHPLDFAPALPPTPEAVVTQKEQTFLPCVLPVTVGSTVYFMNEDQFVHSIYSMTLRSIAIGRRPPGEMHPRKIDKPGVIQLTCDIHTHMRGVVLSLETPYFTRAGADGRYRLRGLPDGRYRIEAYHLDAGKRTLETTLSGGQAKQLDFNYVKP